MGICSDLAYRGFQTAVAIKDDLAQVVIIHAKPVGELLARRLKLCADDDSAQVEEDGFDGHLLFFDVPLAADFFALLFFVSADGVVWRVAVFGLDSSAGTASGLGCVAPFFAGAALAAGAVSATGVDSASGRGASCCGCSFISFSNALSSFRQLGIAVSSRWRGMRVARRQRGQCAS